MDSNKNMMWAVIGVVVLVAIAVGYFYLPKSEKSAVGAAKDASAAVPEIQTNPGEDVPEINPLDRANPFKYENPLR